MRTSRLLLLRPDTRPGNFSILDGMNRPRQGEWAVAAFTRDKGSASDITSKLPGTIEWELRLDKPRDLRYGHAMRVISGLVLAGWLVSGVAAPCFVQGTCAGTTKHECCCGGSATCCCRLSANNAPVSSQVMAVAATASNLLSLPAGEAAVAAGVEVTARPAHGLASNLGLPHSSSLYLSSHAFRC